jgi:hypothetical protein
LAAAEHADDGAVEGGSEPFPERVDESATLPWELSWQASLFGLDPPTVDPTFAGLERHPLDDTSWVEHLPRWLGGSDQVFVDGTVPARYFRYSVPLAIDELPYLVAAAVDEDRAAVTADLEEGKKAGVSGTPSFFVNGVPLAGGLPKAAVTSARFSGFQNEKGG